MRGAGYGRVEDRYGRDQRVGMERVEQSRDERGWDASGADSRECEGR